MMQSYVKKTQEKKLKIVLREENTGEKIEDDEVLSEENTVKIEEIVKKTQVKLISSEENTGKIEEVVK